MGDTTYICINCGEEYGEPPGMCLGCGRMEFANARDIYPESEPPLTETEYERAVDDDLAAAEEDDPRSENGGLLGPSR